MPQSLIKEYSIFPNEWEEWTVQIYGEEGVYNTSITDGEDRFFAIWRIGVFDAEMAKAFVEVYKRGLTIGKEIGEMDKMLEIQRVLGLEER